MSNIDKYISDGDRVLVINKTGKTEIKNAVAVNIQEEADIENLKNPVGYNVIVDYVFSDNSWNLITALAGKPVTVLLPESAEKINVLNTTLITTAECKIIPV